jgi:hypothetical protein
MKKRASVLLLLLLLAAGAASPPASASVLIHLTFAEMTEQSSAILLGRCMEVKSVRTAEGEIVTQNVFDAQEYYKGNLGLRVTITEPGGRVGNFITESSGVPQFTVGEQAVLFVWTSRSGRHQVIGYTQGRFRVRRDAQTGAASLRQSASDEPMLEPPTHTHGGEVSPLVFSLTSFRSQVAVELQRAATLKRAGGSRQ